MAKKNNLYTLSYFRKRLKDEKIYARTVVKKYQQKDKRYWTILIFEDLNIFCTCFKFKEDNNLNYYFSFSDGNNNIKLNKTIRTESMNVILDFLNSINKNKEENGPKTDNLRTECSSGIKT